MPRIPDFNIGQKFRDAVYRILRADATAALKAKDLSPEVERLYRLLLSQGKMVGTINTWMPSLDAQREIAALRDELMEGRCPNTNHSRVWLADTIRQLILSSQELEALSLMENICKPHILNAALHVSEKYPCLFYRIGDVWLLAYSGKKTVVKDTLGIRFIACLLESPLRDCTPRELKEAATGGVPVAQIVKAQIKSEGLSIETYKADPPGSKKEIKAWLEQLYLELETADSAEEKLLIAEKIKEIAKEFNVVISESAKGPRQYRFRRTPPDDTKRSNITIQISDAIKKIKKVHAELGSHLKEAIKTGSKFRYALPGREPGFFVKR